MRLSPASLAAAALCLALPFAAAAQTAAPSSLAKPSTRPTEIIVVGGKPATSARTSARPVAQANGATAGGTSTLRSSSEMSMMDLQSLQSKRATQLQTTTDTMKSASDSQKRVAGNVGK